MAKLLDRIFRSRRKIRELQEKVANLEQRLVSSEATPSTMGALPAANIPAVARQAVEEMLRRTTADGRPNINALWLRINDIDLARLNIKNLGYELAVRLAPEIPPPPSRYAPIGLSCRPCRQDEITSEWFAYWCAELHLAPLFHRKLWEFAFILQSLQELDLLRPGVRALGFGCGEEPIPSYLANRGVDVTVTDLEPEAVAGTGWAETAQHTGTLRQAWRPDLIDWETFEKRARLEYVDMNRIPEHLVGYDFCWSICSLEHLGSIANGLEFVRNSLSTLRRGGYALHTTEFNYADDNETLDNWQTVLFQRKHFEGLATRLRAEGHRVFPLDFNKGTGVLDRFVDLPPYAHQTSSSWDGTQTAHINLSIDGFSSTCFGLLVQRGY